MTQWRTPGEPPRPAGPAASDPDAGPLAPPHDGAGSRPNRPRSALRTQWLVLGVAGAFIVAAVVLLVVVLSGGDDSTGGAEPGSPDAITDKLAAAIHDGSAGQVRAVACRGAEQPLLAATRPLFGTAAARQGTAKVQGAVAVGQIGPSGAAQSGTVGLRRVGTHWCVASFASAG